MSRMNMDGIWIRASKLMQSMSFGVEALTSGATVNVAADSPTFISLVLTGSGQNVVMPAPSTLLEGRFFVIYNKSATALTATIKQNDGTTTVVAIAQNKAALVICDGTTWLALLGA